MIKFKCSKCGEGLEAPDSLCGEVLKCPKCGLHEKVPGKKRNQGSPKGFSKLTTVLIAIIFFIFGGIISGTVFSLKNEHPQTLEIKNTSALPNNIFEMNKEQFLNYCEKKDILPQKINIDPEYVDPEVTHFEGCDLPAFRVIWREYDNEYYIDEIFLGNMHVENSIEGAKPVWEAWKLLQPDIVPLFQKLNQEDLWILELGATVGYYYKGNWEVALIQTAAFKKIRKDDKNLLRATELAKEFVPAN